MAIFIESGTIPVINERLKIWLSGANMSELITFSSLGPILSAPGDLLSDDFRLRYSDKTIFKMAAVRHLEFSTTVFYASVECVTVGILDIICVQK